MYKNEILTKCSNNSHKFWSLEKILNMDTGQLVMKILWNYRLSFVNYETNISAEFFLKLFARFTVISHLVRLKKKENLEVGNK